MGGGASLPSPDHNGHLFLKNLYKMIVLVLLILFWTKVTNPNDLEKRITSRFQKSLWLICLARV